VTGHVTDVMPGAVRGTGISLRFDTLNSGGHGIPIATNLREMASMMDVQMRKSPSPAQTAAPLGLDDDRSGRRRGGLRPGWTSHPRLADRRRSGTQGSAGPAQRQAGNEVPGAVQDNEGLQALWVFASDACRLYGFPDLEIKHTGRNDPRGQIILSSTSGHVHILAGSGLLLRVQ